MHSACPRSACGVIITVVDTLLVQFAREPRPGRVKTRMMPQLSAREACDLHRELVLWTCARLVESGVGDVELCVAGDTADALFSRCRSLGAARVSAQRGADLGERMFRALRRGLRDYRKVVVVGSDCPALSAGYLWRAAAALDEAPVVLGPADDGGYVLIGATAIEAAVFADITWGGSEVCAATRRNLAAAGIGYGELPVLADIDRPEDLPAWEAIRDNVI